MEIGCSALLGETAGSELIFVNLVDCDTTDSFGCLKSRECEGGGLREFDSDLNMLFVVVERVKALDWNGMGNDGCPKGDVDCAWAVGETIPLTFGGP
jgi:hypothetical protein